MPSGLFFCAASTKSAGEEKIRRPTRPLAQSAEIPRVETMFRARKSGCGIDYKVRAIQFMQYYTGDKWAQTKLVMRGSGGSLQSLSADSQIQRKVL